MAVIETHTAVVQADYGQFYVRSGDDWASDQVDGFGYEWNLWSSGGFVYIGTATQHPQVTLTVEVLDAPPGEPGPDWDHVASTSIESVGTLELLDWDPPTEGRGPVTIPLAAGTWRLRVHWRDLASSEVDLDGPEAMTLELWAAPWSETTLDRCWERWWRPAPTDVSPDGRRQVEMGEQIQLRCAHLEPVGRFEPPRPTAETGWLSEYPPMPGGGSGSRCYHLRRDPGDGSFWVEGMDVRETVREVTPAEAAELQAQAIFVPTPPDHLEAWREHRRRQRER